MTVRTPPAAAATVARTATPAVAPTPAQRTSAVLGSVKTAALIALIGVGLRFVLQVVEWVGRISDWAEANLELDAVSLALFGAQEVLLTAALVVILVAIYRQQVPTRR
jgi:hypothetical protein